MRIKRKVIHNKEDDIKFFNEQEIGTVFVLYYDCIFLKISSNYIYYICNFKDYFNIDRILDKVISKGYWDTDLVWNKNDIFCMQHYDVCYNYGTYRKEELEKWILKNRMYFGKLEK